MVKLGHKLTIRPYTEEELGRKPMPTMWDLSVQLDGMELVGLRSLELRLENQEVNFAEMSFVVHEIDVDAEALLEIAAAQKRQKPQPLG